MNREDDNTNNLFFLCSLIELIARKTKNKKDYIIEKLGGSNLNKIYELADVYHSENIEKVANDLIESCAIENGTYDTISRCKERVPSFFEVGRIYARLIITLSEKPQLFIETLKEVLSSWLIEKIDNYDSSMFYENTDYLVECYKSGKVL